MYEEKGGSCEEGEMEIYLLGVWFERKKEKEEKKKRRRKRDITCQNGVGRYS